MRTAVALKLERLVRFGVESQVTSFRDRFIAALATDWAKGTTMATTELLTRLRAGLYFRLHRRAGRRTPL